MGASVRSRDWDEVVDAFGQARVAALPGDGSTHVPGLHLNEPRRGWAAFRTTFRAMFLEEWRETVDFAQARQIILFPLLLSLITAVTTIGLQFLVGTGAAQVSDIDERTFWVRPVGSWVLDSGNVVAQALAVSLDKPLEWAVGFFFGNTELSLELWTVIAGISGFDD